MQQSKRKNLLLALLLLPYYWRGGCPELRDTNTICVIILNEPLWFVLEKSKEMLLLLQSRNLFSTRYIALTILPAKHTSCKLPEKIENLLIFHLFTLQQMNEVSHQQNLCYDDKMMEQLGRRELDAELNDKTNQFACHKNHLLYFALFCFTLLCFALLCLCARHLSALVNLADLH